MKRKKEKENKSDREWRKGFEAGASSIMRENDVAIKLGRAILDALDDRYEFRKEDY